MSEWVALQFSDLTIIKFNMRPKLTLLNFLMPQALKDSSVHVIPKEGREEGKKDK